jgi:3-oxoacyl-[acyl-carrier protein] reductase
MVEQAVAHLGGLDILVNNAGILRDRSLRKMSTEEWESVLRVNLTGVFNVIQASTRHLRPGARIVNLASVSGSLGFFGQANYAASKAAVMALTKVAARELARQQVRVNAVAPGFVDTEMTRSMPPDVLAQFVQQVPLGRGGTPDDVAGAVLFLCSPMSAYVTGQVLHVNGGFFMGG